MRPALDAVLARTREEGRLAFVPFLVVGDPDPDGFLAYVDAVVEGGADLLELGFPYSDPPADGPVIQAADARALAAGVGTRRAFELVAEARGRHPHVPAALLVYFNLVLQYGVEAFYARCREVGIDAVLVADVPVALSGPLVEAARAHRVAPVLLASRVTSADRAAAIAEIAEGYVYAAARVGITGARSDVEEDDLGQLVRRLRAGKVEVPVLAGFGLSTPQHLAAVAEAGASGAIVGSALVAAAAARLPDRGAAAAALTEMCATLSAAARTLRPRLPESRPGSSEDV